MAEEAENSATFSQVRVLDTALKAWKKRQRKPSLTDHMAAKEANSCGKDGDRPTGID